MTRVRTVIVTVIGLAALAAAALAGAAAGNALHPAGKQARPNVVVTPSPVEPRRLDPGETAYLYAMAKNNGPLRLMLPYQVVEGGHAICADLAAGRDAAAAASERDNMSTQAAQLAVATAREHICPS